MSLAAYEGDVPNDGFPRVSGDEPGFGIDEIPLA